MRFELPITIHQPVALDRWLARIGVCAYCQEPSLELKYEGNGFQWRQCRRCAVVFVTPRKQSANGARRMETQPLKVDTTREVLEDTGVYVRAMREGAWVSADIAHLDRGSLLQWLKRDEAGNGESIAVRLVLRWMGWEP